MAVARKTRLVFVRLVVRARIYCRADDDDDDDDDAAAAAAAASCVSI